MKRIASTLSIMTAVCLTACGPLAPDKRSSPVDHGQYLIDQEYYEEAIFTLNTRLEKNPGDLRARLDLASSYAAKHGVVISAFSAVARRLIEANAAPISSHSKHPEGARMEAAARRFQNAMQAFRELPSLSGPEAAQDIQRAIELLEAPGLSPGARLLRALLRVVHVKYIFDHHAVLNRENECQLDTARYREWLVAIDEELLRAIDDMHSAFADPDTKEDLAKSKKGIHQSIQEMMSLAEEFDEAQKLGEDPPLLPEILEEAYEKCAQ